MGRHGFYTAKGNYDSVYSLFDHLCGRGNYTTVFCGQGELFRVPELSARTNEYLSYVKLAGQEYASGRISGKTQELLDQLLLPKEAFEACADASWGIDKGDAKTGEAAAKKESDTLIFTRQMAALYRKENYPGKGIVLEMHYTDVEENSYGGADALQNALFLKTNRILTMAWGVLYLFTSVFTWLLMRTPVSGFVELINSALPIFMGLFTAWFQKWYPAKVASTALRQFNFAMDFSFHKKRQPFLTAFSLFHIFSYVHLFQSQLPCSLRFLIKNERCALSITFSCAASNQSFREMQSSEAARQQTRFPLILDRTPRSRNMAAKAAALRHENLARQTLCSPVFP